MVFQRNLKGFQKNDLKLAYSSVNSLNKFIKTGKNKLNSLGCCDSIQDQLSGL